MAKDGLGSKYSPCSRGLKDGNVERADGEEVFPVLTGLKALLGNSKGVKQVFPVLTGVEGTDSKWATDPHRISRARGG